MPEEHANGGIVATANALYGNAARRRHRGVLYDPRVLRDREPRRAANAEVAKLYPDVIPAIGLMLCLVLACRSGPGPILIGTTILITVFALRLVLKRSMK